MLKHKKVFELIKQKYGYNYRKGNGGIEPKNFIYFNNKNLEFFIEIIPKGKYVKTLYISFVNYEFITNKELEKQKKDIINDIKNQYIKYNDNKTNLCLYSEGIINELIF